MAVALELFSEAFQVAFGKIMDDSFGTQEAGIQLGVVRELVANMTSGLATLKAAADNKDAQLTQVVAEIKGLKNAVEFSKVNHNESKSILDHKAIMNLKALGSDKTTFKLWHEKFVNAFEAAHRGARKIFDTITKEIDEGNLAKDVNDIEEWYERLDILGRPLGEILTFAWDEFGETISFVLVEKCEGDARMRIKTQKMEEASCSTLNYTNGSMEHRDKA